MTERMVLHNARKVDRGAHNSDAFVHQALVHAVAVAPEDAQDPVAPPVAMAERLALKSDLAADAKASWRGGVFLQLHCQSV